MSWTKRRGHTTPSPNTVPPVQMYNPNQHSNQENQWQTHNLHSTERTDWYNQVPPNQEKQFLYGQEQQQSNYWQQPYNQQTYNQGVANQYQYNRHNMTQNQSLQEYYPISEGQPQSIANSQFSQQSCQFNSAENQNNAYAHQRQKLGDDTWNWGWGDEDNSNVQSLPSQNYSTSNKQISNVSDGLVNEESWNWSLDDTNSTTSTQHYMKPELTSSTTSHTSLDSYPQQNVQSTDNVNDQMFRKMGNVVDKQRKTSATDNVELQSNKNFSLDSPQSLITNKHRKMDHLTPQWSIESQLSQESSDDVLQTSESDKILSRSSTLSQSPISGHDAIVDNLQIQEIQQSLPDISIKQELLPSYEQDSLATSAQHENKENVKKEIMQEINIKSNPISPPVTSHTPPTPLKNQTPPLLSTQGSTDDLKNPYKRTTGLSHKAANKFRTVNMSLPDNKQQIFYQPSNFPEFSQSVNLETLPDNSEQPDCLPPIQTSQPIRKISVGKGLQYPDNNEIAPINERNQYLETGQLSDENTNHSQVENFDTLPPPGLRRMVLGQMENDVDLNIQRGSSENVDEPPPGLSRMVLGQTENSLSIVSNPSHSSGPPVGLHRMVPGESSSPESTSRQYQPLISSGYQDDHRHEEYNSEAELKQLTTRIPQPRSATIGADTPPTTSSQFILQNNVNRSETIGADLNVENERVINTLTSENRMGAVGVDIKVRETNLVGANQDNTSKPDSRRESVEGQPQDNEINNIADRIRDINVNSDLIPNVDIPQINRRRSRQESTDSEREIDRSKSPGDSRELRYRNKDDRREKIRDLDKDRGRYSPDRDRTRHSPNADKRYDRRRYRDRKYEEDTDYFSDKERDRRRDDRDKRGDYDKKYNSLRRDKEKEKRRRDLKDYDRRDPRGRSNYYYNRYDDDYDETSRSRPSSRSDSMHESYRERIHDRDLRRYRGRDKERDYHRRPREPFNSYMQGFGYDSYNTYYQQCQYQYYENLRRTNPQAYAEWYRKYYQQGPNSGTFGTEDRASVHSGRSSANDDLKERYIQQSYYSHSSLPHVGGYYREPHSISSQYGMDESSYSRPFDATDSSVILDDTNSQVQRLTPAKFATAHVKASIGSGQLIKILPHYPLDGHNATVELINLKNMLGNDDEMKELLEFPGPLVRGVTHKKTIIEYCENKIRNASYNDYVIDTDSYILMWELMILLIRQNGMVVGTDIAELLMKDRNQDLNFRPSSVASNASSAVNEGITFPEVSNTQSVSNTPSTSTFKEELVTNKFREYLIYGSGKEALEWAMKHGLWGHALFLASKLDKRTYANVMMRFANGLALNDPLQTLYQLLSGRLPAAVTCIADEKWGDWRPHLAMILSNTTSKPELDRKAITTLADTLMGHGSLYAAQFCYLMAEIGFRRYGEEGAKLVLLGSNHNKPFMEFATNEAIHMTEIYEYACSLNDSSFMITEFQPYKYLVATRLSDRGLLEKSLSYLEHLSLSIIQNPSATQPGLVNVVYELADRLKYNDLIEDADENSTVEDELYISRPENTWLKDLKVIQTDYSMGIIKHESVNNLANSTPDLDSLQNQHITYEQQTQNYDAWQQQQRIEQQTYQQTVPQWQTDQYTELSQQEPQQQMQSFPDSYNVHQYKEQNYWPSQQTWQPSVGQYSEPQNNQPEQQQQEQENVLWNSAQSEPDEVEKEPDEVSTCHSNHSSISLQIDSCSSLRKRLSATSPKHSRVHSPTLKYFLSRNEKNINLDSDNDSNITKVEPINKIMKKYSIENQNAEELSFTKNDNFDGTSLANDSSDCEYDALMKCASNFKKEKSQLICYKNNTKIITIKNDSKLTKYNTFDMKLNDKRKMVRYKSLDESEPKMLLKYVDTRSNVSMSAQDFNSDFRKIKFESRKPRHDIINDTVDAWVKKSSKNVFSNIKSSIFKSNSHEKDVVYKPLVFGGTYPIDAPCKETVNIENESSKCNEISDGGAINKYKTNYNKNYSCYNKNSPIYKAPKMREYGPAKSFDIDIPI